MDYISEYVKLMEASEMARDEMNEDRRRSGYTAKSQDMSLCACMLAEREQEETLRRGGEKEAFVAGNHNRSIGRDKYVI